MKCMFSDGENVIETGSPLRLEWMDTCMYIKILDLSSRNCLFIHCTNNIHHNNKNCIVGIITTILRRLFWNWAVYCFLYCSHTRILYTKIETPIRDVRFLYTCYDRRIMPMYRIWTKFMAGAACGARNAYPSWAIGLTVLSWVRFVFCMFLVLFTRWRLSFVFVMLGLFSD